MVAIIEAADAVEEDSVVEEEEVSEDPVMTAVEVVGALVERAQVTTGLGIGSVKLAQIPTSPGGANNSEMK